MRMINIGEAHWVASDTIAEVKVNPQANVLTVRTKDGIGHTVHPGYGFNIYETALRLVDAIDAAT